MLTLDRSNRSAAPAVETFDCWDGSTTELGLGEGPPQTPVAPAATPSAQTPDASASTTSDPERDRATRAALPAATPADEGPDDDHDDEAEIDPLDLLTAKDDDETADGPRPARTIEDRYKILSKRARKLERQLKKAQPTLAALRESGADFRTLLESHQTLSGIQAAAQRDPRLRAVLFGTADEEPRPTRETRRAAAEPESEAVEYPFDTTDVAGKFVADLDRRSRRTERDIMGRLDAIERSLTSRLGRIEETTSQSQRAAITREWKTATDAAAATLEPGVRELFQDALYAAAKAALAGEHRQTPQQVIDHYLTRVKVSRSQAERASAAARQRTAESNTTLLRRPVANGSPASPRSRATPRLSEFNQSLQRRFGAAGHS